MGRKLRRVPLDFDWPLQKTWKGYVNPHYKPCPEMDKSCFNGENAIAVYFAHLAKMFEVIAESAASGQTHPYCYELPYGGWHPQWEKQSEDVRTKMIEITKKLAGARGKSRRGLYGLGDDIYFRLFEMVGVQYEVGKKNAAYHKLTRCPVCKGEGVDPEVKIAYDNWKDYDPPKGAGYQLWETTSDGSPITPVFASLEELCSWAESNVTIFGSNKISAEEWQNALSEEFVVYKKGNMIFI